MTGLSDALADLEKKIKKEHGPHAVTTGDKVPDIGRVPTGFAKLDKILRGGFPKGRITEVWGPQSAGKSTLIFFIIAAIQKADPKARVAYFDLENTFDKAWAARCGIILERLVVVKAMTAERAGDLLLLMVRDKWDMVVVDSVVELIPASVLEKETGKATYAPVANVLSALLPKVVVLQSNSPTVVVLTNQVRDNIGFFLGKGTKSPGGNALFHMDSLKLRVQRKEPITGVLIDPTLQKHLDTIGIKSPKPKKEYGYIMAIKVVKSKVSREKEMCLLPVLFDIGIIEEGTGHAKDSSQPSVSVGAVGTSAVERRLAGKSTGVASAAK
jgi:recombination protein RecA